MTKVHTPDPRDEHRGAASALAGSLLNKGTAPGLEAASTRTHGRDLPTDVKALRVRLRQAMDDAVKAGAFYEAAIELYRDALGHVLNLAQDDEGGDMIEPILQTVRLALDEGKTYDQWSEEQRQQRMAGIDLSGRPA